MDYAPFKIPSQMAGDFSYRSVIPSAQKVPFAAGYLLVNAGMTPPLRYQLFAGLRLAALEIHSISPLQKRCVSRQGYASFFEEASGEEPAGSCQVR